MEEFRDILESLEESSSGIAEMSSDEQATSTISATDSAATITKEFVREVLNSVSNDDILMLGTSGTENAKQITLVNDGDMLLRLIPLQKCLDGGKVRTTEKTWTNFAKCREEIISSVDTIVKNKPLSSFIVHQFMEKIIESTFSSSLTRNITSHEQITDEEREILTYIGGYILLSSKKFFIGKDLHLLIISRATKKEVSNKLITLKTRGGLCEPKDDISLFFVFCESIFRNMFSEKCSPQLFIDYVCAHDDILSLFHNCTYCHNFDEKAYEEVVFHMLKLFYHCRCHAKCRKFMERYVDKFKTQRKQKALRKDLAAT